MSTLVLPSPTLPELGQRAHVRLGRWAVSLRTVVEDVDGGELVLDAPPHLADGQEPEPGEQLLLTWEHHSRAQTLPCSFVGVVDHEPPRWRVVPDGPARVDQRRRHVRAATSARAVVVRDDLPLAATLLDVSEGGLRCRLDDRDAVAGVGDLVSCALRVGDREHELRGRVTQVHLELGTPRVLAVTFLDVTPHEADELRRHVFARQTEARARSIR